MLSVWRFTGRKANYQENKLSRNSLAVDFVVTRDTAMSCHRESSFFRYRCTPCRDVLERLVTDTTVTFAKKRSDEGGC
jgi:hypothetical protein